MLDDGVLHAWFIFNLHTEISFVFTQHTNNQYSHNVQPILSHTLQKTIENPHLLRGPASCSWWQIPFHPGPLSGNNCPTLGFCPFHPFPTPQPILHYLKEQHQQSQSSSSETVIETRNNLTVLTVDSWKVYEMHHLVCIYTQNRPIRTGKARNRPIGGRVCEKFMLAQRGIASTLSERILHTSVTLLLVWWTQIIVTYCKFRTVQLPS